MTTEPSNIFKEFLKFRKKIKQPEQNQEAKRQGKFPGYKYSDLPELQSKVKEALPDDLDYYQMVSSDDAGSIAVKTIFFNSKGETLDSGEFKLPKAATSQMNDIQALGSALTYGRRYQLAAMCGVSSDKDYDAQTVVTESKAKTNKQQSNYSKKANNNKPTNSQLKFANGLVTQLSNLRMADPKKLILELTGKVTDSLENLNSAQISRFIKKIQATIDQEKLKKEDSTKYKPNFESPIAGIDNEMPF